MARRNPFRSMPAPRTIVRTVTRNVKKAAKAVARAVPSYNSTVSDIGVQVGSTVAEVTFSLLSAAVDASVESSESTADDKAAEVAKPLIGTGIRYFAAKVLAKKHPGLAAVMSAGASAWNGDSFGMSYRRRMVGAVDREIAKRGRLGALPRP